MGIRILSPEEIKTGHQHQALALLFPNYQHLYSQRVARLLELAKANPLGNYLEFVAQLVKAQQLALEKYPLKSIPSLSQQQLAYQPFNCQKWQRDNHWLAILRIILAEIKSDTNETLQGTIDWLSKASDTELNNLADLLLAEEISAVGTNKALFIWSALMVYWRQLTQHIPHTGLMESACSLHRCPICNAPPVASVVLMGDALGLRYLHCSLCETEWNMVRAKCSNCENMAHLAYFMEQDQASVRAETCDDCQSYLKIFYQEKCPDLEILADDLASVELDVQLNETGYGRTGFNPYLITE